MATAKELTWFDGFNVSLKLLCPPPVQYVLPHTSHKSSSYFVRTYVVSDNHVMKAMGW